jgi:hypothetical protein
MRLRIDKRPQWTGEELRILHHLCRYYQMPTLMRALPGRSKTAIMVQARRRGLHHEERAHHLPPNITIECECGCGGELERFDHQGRERRFLRGHSERNWALAHPNATPGAAARARARNMSRRVERAIENGNAAIMVIEDMLRDARALLSLSHATIQRNSTLKR